MSRTRLQRLLSDKLQAKGYDPLPDAVATGREAGLSWATIAADITLITGEPCSAQNLIRWYG